MPSCFHISLIPVIAQIHSCGISNCFILSNHLHHIVKFEWCGLRLKRIAPRTQGFREPWHTFKGVVALVLLFESFGRGHMGFLQYNSTLS